MRPHRPADQLPSRGIRVGVDLVDVDRLSRLLASDPTIEQQLFTPAEVGYCAGKRRRDEHLAARFAAKEAVLKALGTGLGAGIGWTDVEVQNSYTGKPSVRLGGGAGRRAERIGVVDLDISLSHLDRFAIAEAVALTADRCEQPGRPDRQPRAAAPQEGARR